MKIELESVPTSTIEKFADKHGLTMTVCERENPSDAGSKYYAKFKDSEVKDGYLLIGSYGNGRTPEEAITNYAKEIELKTLVIAAYGLERKEIRTPRFV